MSGPPPGWQNPHDPYGQYPGHPPPASSSARPSTIAALVVSAVSLAMCCNVFAIGSLVTSALALSRSSTDPSSARSLTRWSWVILAVSFVLGVAFVAVMATLDYYGYID
ncbi:hypothetical protein [Actinomadura flavalba]|uniref:hypothetical protein n=1 Tax=Actinomadura flavalba TaxID=1120938 RepID=UPI000370B39D|nr:hypothetical protein [Actinomadura flavalba]